MSRKAQSKPADLARMEDMERRMAMMEDRLRRVPSRPVQNPATATTSVVTQTTHALAVGNVIRHNGTSWVKSQADIAANAVVGGIVVAVLSPDVFVMATGGYVAGLSGLTAGAVHYLSAGTPGAVTTTPPGRAYPAMLADTTTSGVIVTAPFDRGIWLPTVSLVTSGASWSVPAGVSAVMAVCIAGGGGGAGSSDDIILGYVAATSGGSPTSSIRGRRRGGGGGGGSVMGGLILVTPGGTLTVAIGAAGAAGIVGGSGGAGGNTSAGNMTAFGGSGGTVNAGGRGGVCQYNYGNNVQTYFGASGADGDMPSWNIYSDAAGGGLGGYGPQITPQGGSAGGSRSDLYGTGGQGASTIGGGSAGQAGAIYFYY